MGIYIKSNANVRKTPTSRTMNLNLCKFPHVQLAHAHNRDTVPLKQCDLNKIDGKRMDPKSRVFAELNTYVATAKTVIMKQIQCCDWLAKWAR